MKKKKEIREAHFNHYWSAGHLVEHYEPFLLDYSHIGPHVFIKNPLNLSKINMINPVLELGSGLKQTDEERFYERFERKVWKKMEYSAPIQLFTYLNVDGERYVFEFRKFMIYKDTLDFCYMVWREDYLNKRFGVEDE